MIARAPKIHISAQCEVIPGPICGLSRSATPALPPRTLRSSRSPIAPRSLIAARASARAARRALPNPLRFSPPSIPRFPPFPVPRSVRNQIGAYLRDFRLQCNLTPDRLPHALRLPVSAGMILAWEAGSSSPWEIYVDRISKLAGYARHEGFVDGLRVQFAPWLNPPEPLPSPEPSLEPPAR